MFPSPGSRAPEPWGGEGVRQGVEAPLTLPGRHQEGTGKALCAPWLHPWWRPFCFWLAVAAGNLPSLFAGPKGTCASRVDSASLDLIAAMVGSLAPVSLASTDSPGHCDLGSSPPSCLWY